MTYTTATVSTAASATSTTGPILTHMAAVAAQARFSRASTGGGRTDVPPRRHLPGRYQNPQCFCGILARLATPQVKVLIGGKKHIETSLRQQRFCRSKRSPYR